MREMIVIQAVDQGVWDIQVVTRKLRGITVRRGKRCHV